MTAWDVAIGGTLTRAQRVAKYGGGSQGGIEPAKKSPNLFVYSDRLKGSRYGYHFDGWSEHVFLYTGEGKVGDQILTDGNLRLLHHRDEGLAIRVFVADGQVERTHTVLHRYIGEFEVDRDLPFTSSEAPDINGEMRTVLVFRLKPIGQVLRRPSEEAISMAVVDELTVEVVDAGSREESDVEKALVNNFQRRAQAAVQATRREAQLVGRYRQHLESQGHKVQATRIRRPGDITVLRTDLEDVTTSELVEAKASTSRESVRLAVGQLFDYQRTVQRRTLAVLLPTQPPDDLVDLIVNLGIGCIYEGEPNEFHRIDPEPHRSGRCAFCGT